MQTIKVISNISYNTPDYFSDRITQLFSDHKIDWCYWIVHQPDIDEKKEHIHFVFKPSARIDTADFREYLNEFDPHYPSKPKTCTAKFNFCNSMDDWLLYGIHDIGYLASKGQQRNIHYSFDDISSTDPDSLLNDIANINYSKYKRLQALLDAARENVPFALLVQQGVVPIAQRQQYQFQYDDILKLIQSGNSGRLLNHEKEV